MRISLGNQIFFIIILVLFNGCSSSSNGIVGYPVDQINQDLIKDALSESFIVVEEYLAKDEPVVVISSGQGEISQKYVDSIFPAYLISKGYNVLQAGEIFLNSLPNSERNGNAVQLTVLNIGVDYNQFDGKRSDSKKLSRAIKVQLLCKVVEITTGSIVSAREIEAERSDLVQGSRIERLQNKALPFTIGEFGTIRKSKWELFELGSVLATAGAIIYLFFSTRS